MLSRYTTLRVGGNAMFVVRPSDVDGLINCIKSCLDAKLRFRVIGRGSNLFCSDEGFDGLVVLTHGCNGLTFASNYVEADCGVPLHTLIYKAVRHGFGGIEYLISVPGSVGGAIFTNAGRARHINRNIGDHVCSVRIFDGTEIQTLSQQQCEFGHRDSIFQKRPDWTILSVTLTFSRQPDAKGYRLVRDRIRQVRITQDRSHPNAGSVFRQGYQLDLRGYRQGGASFSKVTPNWIVNDQDATSADIESLIRFAVDQHMSRGLPPPALEWQRLGFGADAYAQADFRGGQLFCRPHAPRKSSETALVVAADGLTPCEKRQVRGGKIGVATLHYGFNEGAVLQAYSVAAKVEEILPEFQTEIVDQRYPAKCRAEGPPNDKRKKALRRAVDAWLPLSSRQFLSDSHREAVQYIVENYRALVVGSDVLWRLRYKRYLGGLIRIQRQGFFTPFPNLYWPDETIRIPKFAYAASLGTTDWRDIPSWHRRRMRSILSDFSLLSVRDLRTLRFLEWLDTGLAQRTVLVPDPTWSVDLVSLVDVEALRQRLEAYGVDFSRPRCGFIAGPGDAARGCAHLLRQKGYQIIGVTTRNDFSDVPLFEHGFHPLEWARLPGFLDVCVSERMHGCIFCLLNRTPFVALDINESRGDRDTKLKDLLRGFGLERFCFPKSSATATQLADACARIAAHPWDWDSAEQRINGFRRTARDFLEQMRRFVSWNG